MIGSFMEMVALTEDELREADKIAAAKHCRAIYVPPNLVQVAGVARNLSGGKYQIYVIVDPKGHKYGVDKFKGTAADFFLADGYDIVLTPDRSKTDMEKEVSNLHTFVKTMISQHTDICFTLNVSLRDDDELVILSKMFHKYPVAKIKTESSTNVQPTKANLDVHQKTVKIVRTYCTTPIVISGNVNYNIYKEMTPGCKVAISPTQYGQIETQKEVDEAKVENR